MRAALKLANGKRPAALPQKSKECQAIPGQPFRPSLKNKSGPSEPLRVEADLVAPQMCGDQEHKQCSRSDCVLDPQWIQEKMDDLEVI